ncbi:hypothetical protein NJF44_20755 [Pseudomonas guariconensis]|uniref:hypothetical protein n=1 Tax=Pseudomonas TaxID=286 RepID=UPI001CE4607B|nr:MULTISPECIES: hypothetical protein [Pseudomonas]MCO7637273.1 hypothetical protein [Pseudomonas sp. S 311-6]MCO7517373.1 hypothetical protein [Pseudomonas putida]MCO7567355.1 hypothetical protein [Pseudomonas mosselii]MCO7596902.1 hypothetical protein [Pseudomonas guariconensis]MCO7607668.1 hypothetical protein [Pseudomonas guariconensis]
MRHTESISPLTIIAIFAGIIEASALASLPFLSENSQTIYTWFLVGFPFFLTVLFFLTLNFNYRSLYQPARPEPAAQADASSSKVSTDQADARKAMTIALSGPDTRKMIEQHILRTLTQPHARARTWVLHNLDTRTCIHLSVNALEHGEEKWTPR